MAKLEDFVPGVAIYYSDDRCSKGTIIDPDGFALGPNQVLVRWPSGHKDIANISELSIVDAVADKQAAQQIQKNIDQATSAFEKAFASLKKATQAAYKMSSLQSLESENLIDLSDLEEVFNSQGWSTSSLYC